MPDEVAPPLDPPPAPAFWATCQAVGQAVRPSRFSIAILVLGVGAFFLADQTPEALMTLCQRNDALAVLAFILAVLMWGHTSWYLARVLSRFEYPDRTVLPPRAQALEHGIVEWLPRALGVAPMVVVTMALLLCARRTNAVVPAAVGVLLTGVAWGAFLVGRRRILDALRKKAGTAGGSRLLASLFEELGGFRHPDKQTFAELPAITRFVLWTHVGFFFALVVLFAASPIPIPRWLGAQTVLVLAMAGWVVAGSWVTYLGSWLRMPLFLFVAGYAVVISPCNDDHVAAARPANDATPDGRPTLKKDFADWQAKRGGPGTPFVLVATEGGGIRAAYWTAAMLAALQDTDRTFASRVYAISSVSGGSVGAAVFDALVAARPPNYRNAAGNILSNDSLAPALARMLYPDLVQRFVFFPVPGADRGAALEESWTTAVQREFPASHFFDRPLDDGFWADEGLPRLFLNTTWVETGKRVVLAYPKAVPPCMDTLDGDALARFTVGDAVLSSARFAYVSPAETVPGPDGKGVWGHLVDGGYFENSGALTAAELLGGIGDDDHAYVILLRYDDGAAPQPSKWATEVAAPPAALLATRDAREALALASLKSALRPGHVAEFVLKPTGNPLPLGWMLSAEARTDINARVDEALKVGMSPPSPGRQVLGWWGGR